MNFIAIDICTGGVALMLTVLIVPLLRFGYPGALFNARVVRKLGRFSGMIDQSNEFNIEILELQSSNGKSAVGMQVRGTYRASLKRIHRHMWRSFSKEDALEFARLLRKTADAAEQATNSSAP